MPVATITINGTEYRASETRPVVFGRADGPGVVGLDPSDRGISAVAGSVEWRDVWLVVNRSRKRRLHIDEGGGGGPRPLECGHVHAVNTASLTVEVHGDIRLHGIGVAVPKADLLRISSQAVSTGTLLPDISLDTRERDVAVALFEGYLLPFPRRQPRPRTYQQAARRLGQPWTKDAVRKEAERLKLRLSRTGPPLEGRHALDDLADYLIGNNVIGPDDLDPDDDLGPGPP